MGNPSTPVLITACRHPNIIEMQERGRETGTDPGEGGEASHGNGTKGQSRSIWPNRYDVGAAVCMDFLPSFVVDSVNAPRQIWQEERKPYCRGHQGHSVAPAKTNDPQLHRSGDIPVPKT